MTPLVRSIYMDTASIYSVLHTVYSREQLKEAEKQQLWPVITSSPKF